MAAPDERDFGSWGLFVAGLSAIVVVAGVWLVVARPDPGAMRILAILDLAACFVFFVDFVRRLRHAPDRWRYLRGEGILDLVSSRPLPLVWPSGQLARVARVVRLFRVLQAGRRLVAVARRRRGESLGVAVALLLIVLLGVGSILILQLEQAVTGAKITRPEDSLWWAFVTMTTVGYGDLYPVTGPGRLVAGALMIGGVLLFATLSGWFASQFVGQRAHHEDGDVVELRAEVSRLRERLESEGSRT